MEKTRGAVECCHNMILGRRAKMGNGTIVVPNSAQGEAMSAEVVAVGPGHWQGGTFIPTTVKPHDKVWFRLMVKLEVPVNGENLACFSETEVAAVERCECAECKKRNETQRTVTVPARIGAKAAVSRG